MNSNKQGDKSVYYHQDKFMHVVKVVDENNRAASQNSLKYWAFLVVGDEEVKSLISGKNDKQAIRDAIKEKYLPYLETACENELDKQQRDVVQRNHMINNKLISSSKSSSLNTNSLGVFLKGNGFSTEYNHLEDEYKEQGTISHFLSLKLSTKECEKVLNQELSKTKINVGNPFAVVALPFYHKKKGRAILKGAEYSSLASVALMPKRVIEYGIFFDGTANNKYNVDFYRKFDKFLQKETEIIEQCQSKTLELKTLDAYISGAEYIAAVDNPQKVQVIMNLIRKEIMDFARYFEKDSLDRNTYDSPWDEDDEEDFFRDDASAHTERVFDFLMEVKNDDKIENEINKAIEDDIIQNNDASRKYYRPFVFQKFIEENILPSNAEGSSFVNGVTNIARLFDLYDGHDQLNLSSKGENGEEHLEHFNRFKVYASGSGTIDPIDKEGLTADSIILGSALALGEGGMKAHIIYTCQKMASELRKAEIYCVDELVLDIFGFSRGSTEARHFVCSIMEEYNLKETGNRTYTLDTTKPTTSGSNIFSPFFTTDSSNPLFARTEYSASSPVKEVKKIEIKSVSFRFVGIYDTVSHLGLSQGNDAEDLNLHFYPEKAGRVIHMRSNDEYRYNFETASIKKTANEILKENMEEIMLPGAHADVGGAYNLGADELVHIFSGTEIVEDDFYDEDAITTGIGKDDKVRLKAWNDKYGWTDEAYSLTPLSITAIKKDKVDGFYSDGNSIYMYRQNISNGYELVTLKLMYDKAIRNDANANALIKQKVNQKRELVPFNKPSLFKAGKYKIESKNKIAKYDKYKLEGFLEKIYKNLSDKDVLALSDEELKSLRRNYLHHSIDDSKIANISALFKGPPSEGDELYKQRVVHGSQEGTFPDRKR